MNSKTCVFSPKAASELGLDGADLILLENFIQKKDSNRNYIKTDNKTYYFLDGQRIEENLPILKIKKASIYKRFLKMIEIGVLDKITINGNGDYIYCALGPNYYFLTNPNKYQKYTPLKSINK